MYEKKKSALFLNLELAVKAAVNQAITEEIDKAKEGLRRMEDEMLKSKLPASFVPRSEAEWWELSRSAIPSERGIIPQSLRLFGVEPHKYLPMKDPYRIALLMQLQQGRSLKDLSTEQAQDKPKKRATKTKLKKTKKAKKTKAKKTALRTFEDGGIGNAEDMAHD